MLPNHLLLLQNGTTLPPGIFAKGDLYSRKRWRQVRYLWDVFWGHGTKEYLPLLQLHQKWYCPKRNFTVEHTVIVIDESTSQNVWGIGRLTEVFSDKCGLVGPAKVKTKKSTLEHPKSKLCLLESRSKSSLTVCSCVTSGIA